MRSTDKTPEIKTSKFDPNSSLLNSTLPTAPSSNDKSLLFPQSSYQSPTKFICHNKKDFPNQEEAEKWIWGLIQTYNKKIPVADISDDDYELIIEASDYFNEEYKEFKDYYVVEFSNIDFINYYFSFYVEYNFPEEMQGFLCMCLFTLSCKYEVTPQAEAELMLNFKYLVNNYQFKNQHDVFNEEEDLDDLEVELQKFMKNNWISVSKYFDTFPDLKEFIEIDEL